MSGCIRTSVLSKMRKENGTYILSQPVEHESISFALIADASMFMAMRLFTDTLGTEGAIAAVHFAQEMRKVPT